MVKKNAERGFPRSAFCIVPPFTFAGRSSALPVILRVAQKYKYILNCAIGSRNSEQSLRKTEQRFLRRRGAGGALL